MRRGTEGGTMNEFNKQMNTKIICRLLSSL